MMAEAMQSEFMEAVKVCREAIFSAFGVPARYLRDENARDASMDNHPEKQALFQGVREEPDGDAPRLVYADWLEENGDEDDRLRAEFIRLQIRMEKGCAVCDGTGRNLMSPCNCTLSRYRETALLDNCYKWHSEIPGFNPQWKVTFRRGFPFCVECLSGEWQLYGPRIVRETTVQEAMLAGKTPALPEAFIPNQERRCYWVLRDDGREDLTHWIPQPFSSSVEAWDGCFMDRIAEGYARWFTSPRDADSRLSRALIAWARQGNA